ncbi:histidinol dehydrogenase [Cyclobacteriaceae bacterium]|nr:histidinol dehydrogenase [Cyclobacteriaceae bacterium]
MNIYKNPSEQELKEILKRPAFEQSGLESKVQTILDEVKAHGDDALKNFAQKFDGVTLDSLLVSEQEFDEAENLVDQALKDAIAVAKANIEKFHTAQKNPVEKVETMPGVVCWREDRPIEKVGLYIPGGTAPLFSTILMLVVPAKVAGCKEIVLCTPPNKEGKVHPAILYTAKSLGVTTLVKAGGAQAVAAMAFGTESVPSVYKIFGPGNQFVTMAKQMVQTQGLAIDMPAGPSEVLVLSDETSNPEFIAIDLLSQAEHGLDSQAIHVTTSLEMAEKVNEAIDRLVAQLSRQEFLNESLKNSKTVVVETIEGVIDTINEYAPEHLILQNKDYNSLIDEIVNAGSVFLGPYTPESAGDYASGTNHTLPTNGYAAMYSGVSLDSFVKRVTFQEISKEGIEKLGPSIEVMAQEEQLDAHKMAVTLRLK